MKVLVKGIVTAEDAALAVDNGIDGIVVSNHGGRAEASMRSTIECLPEIVDTVRGRIAVLVFLQVGPELRRDAVCQNPGWGCQGGIGRHGAGFYPHRDRKVAIDKAL